MYEHGKNRQFVQTIIYIYIFCQVFCEICLILFVLQEIWKKTAKFMQIFKYYACFLLFLHHLLHFCRNLPVFTVITEKHADDDGKAKIHFVTMLATQFRRRASRFSFSRNGCAPFCAIYKLTIIMPYFDFLLKFCYNIYRKRDKNNSFSRKIIRRLTPMKEKSMFERYLLAM